MSEADAQSPAVDAAINVSELVLEAGERRLVDGGSFRVEHGDLCLLVGASGTGKSLTLSLLSGLLANGDGIEVSGRVSVLGTDPLVREEAGIPGTGILFQDFALFDDLDARGNIQFGLDHGGTSPGDRAARTESLLEEFGLAASQIPARMSGGMRQRLALARTLAFEPRLIFYDEPTSGLDPAMSQRVAERIRRVHDEHRMTSVVVTHDLTSLLGIADRVIFLDPERKCFREIPPDRTDETLAALRHFRPDDEAVLSESRTAAQATIDFLEAAGGFVHGALSTLCSLVPRYPQSRWGLRFLWYDLKLTALGTAIPFLALAGLIAGFITTFFMFSLLPVRGYTEPVLIEEFLGSLGFALYRVVTPVITSLLFASRSGAAIAADIGNRNLMRQVDALRSYGIPPRSYLLSGLSLAALLGIPILFIVTYVVARITSVGVFLATHEGQGSMAFDERFSLLVGTWGPFPGGTGYVIAKLLLSALGTAGIAFHLALRTKRSGADVARGVTDTIIKATIFVLLVHLVFAFFEF